MLPSATFSATESSSAPLPLLQEDVVATSPKMQQISAVRHVTRDLQQRKPRHPKRPQLLPGEACTPTKRIVLTALHEQKLTQYNNVLKLYEQ